MEWGHGLARMHVDGQGKHGCMDRYGMGDHPVYIRAIRGGAGHRANGIS